MGRRYSSSVEGSWSVRGQSDLYRAGHGEALGLTLNDASFLLPHVSNSALIGIGPHYKGQIRLHVPRVPQATAVFGGENMTNGGIFAFKSLCRRIQYARQWRYFGTAFYLPCKKGAVRLQRKRRMLSAVILSK